VTGVATAPAAGRAPAVTSRVAGYFDPPSGGGWVVECGMPWTDGGSHSKLAADGSDYGAAFFVRLRLEKQAGTVVFVGTPEGTRIIQAEKFHGSPESFTAEITCLASDDKTPIRIGLEGGRIGIVKATIQSAAGRAKEWKGAATVWAWPDAPGFTGGREQNLEQWQHIALDIEVDVETARSNSSGCSTTATSSRRRPPRRRQRSSSRRRPTCRGMATSGSSSSSYSSTR